VILRQFATSTRPDLLVSRQPSENPITIAIGRGPPRTIRHRREPAWPSTKR
jgi:hypothetical protein